MKKIGIIGPNVSMCSKQVFDFGVELGNRISTPNRTTDCGGLGGFIEAVWIGVKQSPNTFYGQTLGKLPDSATDKANPFIWHTNCNWARHSSKYYYY